MGNRNEAEPSFRVQDEDLVYRWPHVRVSQFISIVARAFRSNYGKQDNLEFGKSESRKIGILTLRGEFQQALPIPRLPSKEIH